MKLARVAIVSVLLGLLSLTFLDGCSSSTDSDAPAGPCAARQGTYRVVATQRSGSCGRDGETGEAVVTFDQQAGYASGGGGCQTAYVRGTDDNCVIEYDETCPFDLASLPNGKIRKVGKATWNQPGTSANVTEQWTVYNEAGRVECTSAVDVTYTKQ